MDGSLPVAETLFVESVAGSTGAEDFEILRKLGKI